MNTNPGDEPPPTAASSSELDALLFDVLEHDEATRERFIAERCAGRPDLERSLRRRMHLLADAGLFDAPDPRTEPVMPERLGEFRLIEKLGSGGMGVVYLALQESLGREVALKLVRPEQLYFEGARRRFQREVRTVARLAHPGIVPVFAVGEENGIPFFAMERVRGCTLHHALSKVRERDPAELAGADLRAAVARASGAGTADGGEAPQLFRGTWTEACLRVLREVAEALEHAHRSGVVHRDVKPSNIMVTSAGRVMLVDFGLSSSQGTDRLTRSGSAMGSLPYMSPEQLSGRARPDERSDVYGLGVTLFELLTLRLPYEGANVPVLRDLILAGRPPSLRALNPSASWEAETVCQTAMELDPARRYPSAGSFASDVSNALEGRPIAARRPGFGLRARRWLERHPAWGVGAGLGFLLLVVAPALFAWQMYRSNARLAAKNAELTRAQVELRASLGEVERQRGRALRNFDLADEALSRVATRVGDIQLPGVPHVQEVRREILVDSLRFREELLEQAPDDPAQRLEHARSLNAVARIQGYLNRRAESLGAYRREEQALVELLALDPAPILAPLGRCLASQARVERLGGALRDAEQSARRGLRLFAEHPPRDREGALARAQLLLELGDALQRQERLEQAREVLTDAVEELRPVAFGQGSREARDRLAETLHVLGTPRTIVGPGREAAELERCRRFLGEAIELREAILEEIGENPDARHDLTMSLVSLANIHLAAGELEQAGPLFERSLAINEALRDDFPSGLKFAEGVATCRLGLANLASLQGQPQDELAHLQRAASELDALIAADPENPDFALRGLYSHYGVAFGQAFTRSAHEEAYAHCARAHELVERLSKSPAGLSATGRDLAFRVLGVEVSCLMDDGRHADGAARVESMAELASSPEQWVECAEYLGLGVRAARADAGLARSEADARAAEYADSGLMYVERALSGVDAAAREALLARPALAPLQPWLAAAGLIEEPR